MIRRLTAVAALLLASSAAFAGTAIDTANNQVRASAVHQKFDYSEVDAYGATKTGVLDSERGNQNGIAAGVTVQRDIAGIKNVYFDAEVTRITGSTAYDGYLQGGATLVPYKTTTDYTSTDFQVKLGKGVQFGPFNDVQVTPYVTIGTYNWLRDSSADQYGYAERYKHKYAAIGALLQYEFSPRAVGSIDYMAGRTNNATMTLVADGTEFALGAKPIQAVTLGLDYAVNKNVHVQASYRHTEFKYGESSSIGAYLEPNSQTKRDQVAFGVGYAF